MEPEGSLPHSQEPFSFFPLFLISSVHSSFLCFFEIYERLGTRIELLRKARNARIKHEQALLKLTNYKSI
jgi:hypothetical protein